MGKNISDFDIVDFSSFKLSSASSPVSPPKSTGENTKRSAKQSAPVPQSLKRRPLKITSGPRQHLI